MKLTNLDVVVVVIYVMFLSAIGIYFFRRQTSREEYLMGGRSMHWMLLGGSMMATLLSTITFLSVPGEMIRFGIALMSGTIAMPLFVPVANRILIPVLRRLSITSAYAYLEKRFDVRFRILTSFIFVLRTIIWMGLIIYTCSFAVSAITGWDLYLTIVIAGLVTTLYTTAGGLRTVVWTDNLQLVILLGGALAIPVVIGFSIDTGPVSWWSTFSEAGRTQIQLFSWDLTVRITVVGIVMSNFFWNICTLGGDQVAVQRYLSCPNLSAARKTVWTFALLNFIVTVALLFCGLSLFAFYAGRSGLSTQAFQEQIATEADRIMPMFIVDELPAGVSGLLLAALLAAAMSSLSSGINSISGVVVSDFFERFSVFKTYVQNLWADKVVSLIAGLVGVGTSVSIALMVEGTDWNLIELAGRLNHIFVGPLGVLFFAGILFRHVGKQAAFLGFATATLMSLFICFGKEWFGLEKSLSFIWVVPLPFLVGLALAGLGAYLFPRPSKHLVNGLTLHEPQSNDSIG